VGPQRRDAWGFWGKVAMKNKTKEPIPGDAITSWNAGLAPGKKAPRLAQRSAKGEFEKIRDRRKNFVKTGNSRGTEGNREAHFRERNQRSGER